MCTSISFQSRCTLAWSQIEHALKSNNHKCGLFLQMHCNIDPILHQLSRYTVNDQVFLDRLYWSFWLNQIVLLSLSMVLRWGLALSPILISTMSADNDWNCIKVNRKMIYFSLWIKSALLNCLKVGDVYLNMKTLGIKKLKRLRNQS